MKRTSLFPIAAVVAASAFALHAPVASAAGSATNGVPGVDVDVGKNASDKGVPGVEMNVGKDGDQKNINKDQAKKNTRSLGAGKTMDTKKPVGKRADKN